jgi:hypothetical protein
VSATLREQQYLRLRRLVGIVFRHGRHGDQDGQVGEADPPIQQADTLALQRGRFFSRTSASKKPPRKVSGRRFRETAILF